jgi:hypothetical protein
MRRWLLLAWPLLCSAGCSSADEAHTTDAGGKASAGSAAGKHAADAGRGGDAETPEAGRAEGTAGAGGAPVAAAPRKRLQGVAQKGPYVRGASIVVSELDAELAQTGRSFNAQITDNSGRFAVSVTSLSGPYVRLNANGFYYNEVSGALSAAPLALVALADPSASDSVNVNILTDLETPRVEYLVQNGSSFTDAKQQAQREVLKVFRIEVTTTSSSEALDLAGGSEADAALLAASVLLQGYLSVGELSELLSTIGNDLREDGTLDNAQVGTLLMNSATLVGPSDIRQKIAARYAELGITVATGDFESHIARFRDEAPYPYVSRTMFPATGGYGENVLALKDGGVVSSGYHSFAAKTPAGQPLRVRMTANLPGMDPGDFSDRGDWGLGNTSNWTASYDIPGRRWDLTVVDPGSFSDAFLNLDYYVEVEIHITLYEGLSEVQNKRMLRFMPK